MTIWEIVFMLAGFVSGAVAMASWQLHRDTKRRLAQVEDEAIGRDYPWSGGPAD